MSDPEVYSTFSTQSHASIEAYESRGPVKRRVSESGMPCAFAKVSPRRFMATMAYDETNPIISRSTTPRYFLAVTYRFEGAKKVLLCWLILAAIGFLQGQCELTTRP